MADRNQDQARQTRQQLTRDLANDQAAMRQLSSSGLQVQRDREFRRAKREAHQAAAAQAQGTSQGQRHGQGGGTSASSGTKERQGQN